jgi:hypothetical protein
MVLRRSRCGALGLLRAHRDLNWDTPSNDLRVGIPDRYNQRHTSSAQWVRVGFITLQHCAVASGTDAKVLVTVLIGVHLLVDLKMPIAVVTFSSWLGYCNYIQ